MQNMKDGKNIRAKQKHKQKHTTYTEIGSSMQWDRLTLASDGLPRVVKSLTLYLDIVCSYFYIVYFESSVVCVSLSCTP